jgi:hypothetical protein
LPQLPETSDFLRFKFITLNRAAVERHSSHENSGLYTMLALPVAENLYVMSSDHLHF